MSTKKSEEMRAQFGARMAAMAAPRPGASPQGPAPSAGSTGAGVTRLPGAAMIPLDLIERDPNQPREEFDAEAIERLAHSIREKGVLQPIRARKDEGRGVYTIIAGERRFRAAKAAGLESIPCVIHDGALSPGELLALQVTENALREDLNPVERARAYKALMDLNGWSGNQLAKELGIAQSAVVNAFKLPTLPAPVQEMIARGELAASTGMKLADLDDPAEQAEAAAEIVGRDMSRDEATRLIRARSKAKGKGRGAKAKPSKVTKRTIRTLDRAASVTVIRPKGLDAAAMIAALLDVVEQLRAEGRAEAAA